MCPDDENVMMDLGEVLRPWHNWASGKGVCPSVRTYVRWEMGLRGHDQELGQASR